MEHEFSETHQLISKGIITHKKTDQEPNGEHASDVKGEGDRRGGTHRLYNRVGMTSKPASALPASARARTAQRSIDREILEFAHNCSCVWVALW